MRRGPSAASRVTRQLEIALIGAGIAGLTVSPNATHVLEAIGLGPLLARLGMRPDRGGVKHWRTGELPLELIRGGSTVNHVAMADRSDWQVESSSIRSDVRELLDAVPWAVAQKITTQDRVAIYGGSYGSNATPVGLTMTPDGFACAVDIAGPSSLATLIGSIPPYWKACCAEFALRVGDPRVKQAESDSIVAAMTAKRLPVTYVLHPEEGHGFAPQRAFCSNPRPWTPPRTSPATRARARPRLRLPRFCPCRAPRWTPSAGTSAT